MADGKLFFEDFKDRVGNTFTVTYPDFPPIALLLEEAAPLPNYRPNHRPPFSLIFLGPNDPMLLQATHRLAHDEMGDLDIFLVPIGKDERGYSYQAVFN